MSLKKTTLLVCLFVLAVTQVTYSQNQEDFKKIKAMKVAYFTEHLDLSSEEATQFWPIYNVNEEKQVELYVFLRENFNPKMIENQKGLTNKEAQDKITKYLELKEAADKAYLTMFNKLRGTVPDQKALALVHVEEGFRRHLMMLYRKHRNNDKK